MKIIRVKKNGQRLWRIEMKDGKYLGRRIANVWPIWDLKTPLTESQVRYRTMCFALNRISSVDEKGFYYLIDGYAELAMEALKLCKGWKPVPGWAVYAVVNGWRIPKGWSTDNSCGDTVMPNEQLAAWLEKHRAQREE